LLEQPPAIIFTTITGVSKDAEGRVQVQLDGVAQTLEVSRRHAAGIRQLVKALQD